MIPKIIHLCWLSGDKFPDSIRQCLDTWLVHLKEYEVWMWTSMSVTPESQKENGNARYFTKLMPFDLDSMVWTKQAYEAKKYAFAADLIRLKALYEYGGIYLDADVLVYKPFDDLLQLPYFIGCDQIRAFEAAVIGCEKGFQWVKDVLDTYQGKEFIKPDGTYDQMELPVRFHHVLTGLGYKFYKVSRIDESADIVLADKMMYVFDKDFFNSRNAVEVHPTKKSYTAHNYAGSWNSKKAISMGDKIKSMLPKWLLALIYRIGQATWAKNKYAWFQIPFCN